MKKITLLFILSLLPFYSFSQLNVGDIAFIGVNEDPGPGGDQDHSFTFITLTNIPAGEVIYFTEQGVDVNTMTWFGNTEGHYSWTSPTGGLSCGTVVAVYESVSNPDTLIASSGTMSGVLNGSGWNLSAGDQVIAYQANNAAVAIGSCTFIAGIHMEEDLIDGETNGWTSISYSGTGVSYSHLPPGLTDGINCISLFSPTVPEQDNAKYTGTLIGSSDVLRSLINTATNWSTNDITPFDISTSGFSPNVNCSTCTDPTIPTVTASTNPICDGNSTTLNISGTLNDATQWAIYTGSCGGNLVGTTATFSINVTPTGPSTTYYVRGEGGCVTPGSCGTITINVNTPANAGASGSTNICNNGIIINLYDLIFGEQPGGVWTQIAGTGGVFNQGAGTFTSAPDATTSIFSYTVAGTFPCFDHQSTATININSLNYTISENTTGILTANESGATYQWYQCPNTLLNGETNQSFTPSATGDYKVEITKGGCTIESSCYTVSTLDTKTFENDIKFVIYPNPSNSLITIKTDASGEFVIVNQLGQTVKSIKVNSNIEKSINIENLAEGIYFIKSSSNSQIKAQKLIIRK